MNIVVCTNERAQLEAVLADAADKVVYFDSGYGVQFYLIEIAKGLTDIFICDVDMPDTDMIDLAKRIKNYFPQIKIIFFSHDPHSCQKIFETEPTYFLLKPVGEVSLRRAIDKAKGLVLQESTDFLLVNTKSGIVKVSCKSILYLESKGRLVRLHTHEGIREFYKRLDDIMPSLPTSFVRCHKSFVTNLDKVKMLTGNTFVLFNDVLVPISQSHYAKTKEIFLRLSSC